MVVGVSTYTPPSEARADVVQKDVREAISKLIAYTARDLGFDASRSQALERFGELVNTCTLHSNFF